jgi:hypothetical protein
MHSYKIVQIPLLIATVLYMAGEVHELVLKLKKKFTGQALKEARESNGTDPTSYDIHMYICVI